MRLPGLPKGVVFLGLASLLNDVASEAIYPLLPLFLTSVLGAGAVFLGALEGTAETVASVAKFVAGYYSDRLKKRGPFVFVGYGIAAVARPLIGLATATWHVFLVRFADRLGKGIRTAPRDAWLAGFANRANRGWVFGFHRSMDHAGAMIGPLLATAFLFVFPGQYRALFLAALVPGILALFFVVFAGREARLHIAPGPVSDTAEPLISKAQVRSLPRGFFRFLAVLGLFTLGNSTDVFLLLRLRSLGVADAWIPGAWAAFSFVKMVTSSWGGIVSDRLGRRVTIISGWLLYAAVYVGFAVATSLPAVLVIFLIYGVFYGFTDGPEKALVADMVPGGLHGTAYGLYNLVIGVGALPASLIFGFMLQRFGFGPAFILGAILAALGSVLLASVKLPSRPARV